MHTPSDLCTHTRAIARTHTHTHEPHIPLRCCSGSCACRSHPRPLSTRPSRHPHSPLRPASRTTAPPAACPPRPPRRLAAACCRMGGSTAESPSSSSPATPSSLASRPHAHAPRAGR
eukprot:1056648-Prymnesium_polylepis.1